MPTARKSPRVSPKKKKEDDVSDFMKKLKHPLKAEIEAVRSIIRKANKKLSERIKWNAPSYYFVEDFAAFNLRETKFVHLILLFPDA